MVAENPSKPTIDQGPLNILLASAAPGPRSRKTVLALRAAGHTVTLAHTGEIGPGQCRDPYHQCLRLRGPGHLWDISGGFDLVHCQDPAGALTVAALAGDAPVVYEAAASAVPSDSEPGPAFLQGVAVRGAAGRVFSSPGLRKAAEDRLNITGPSVVMYGYPCRADLPDSPLAKLSTTDHKTHLAYHGDLGSGDLAELADFFSQLIGRGLAVHLHPARAVGNEAAALLADNGVILEPVLSPGELLEAMTAYDLGVIHHGPDRTEHGLSRVLFDYLAAGLPVAASGAGEYLEYLTEHRAGRVFESADELAALIPELLSMAGDGGLSRLAPGFESQAEVLDRLYLEVLERAARPKTARFDSAVAPPPEAAPSASAPAENPVDEAHTPKTMFFVNALVDFAKLGALLDSRSQPYAVTSVDKQIMARIHQAGFNALGPEDVGQNYWLERMAWGPVYPERTKHYHIFQEAFRPLMDMEAVRKFSGLDLYQGGEFNQANNVGYCIFKLVDILHDLLENYQPAEVVCLENGDPEPSVVCRILGDLSDKFGFELKALREQ